MRKLIFLCLILLINLVASAQTVVQHSGWLTFVNHTNVTNKLGFSLDVQIRSADRLEYVRNVLVRPGITYNLNKFNVISTGYLWASTETKGSINTPTVHEHRIWEQYVLSHRLKSVFMSHRLRLEQRFIEQQNGSSIFAQRVRFMVKAVQPLQGKVDTFTNGFYVALQDEIFINVQNKDLLNKSLFDQNRLYLGLGYRLSKKLDLETGYLNQHTNGLTINTTNNVVQFAVSTRF